MWAHHTCGSIETWLQFLAVIEIIFAVDTCVTWQAVACVVQHTIMTDATVHTLVRVAVINVKIAVVAIESRETLTCVAKSTVQNWSSIHINYGNSRGAVLCVCV